MDLRSKHYFRTILIVIAVVLAVSVPNNARTQEAGQRSSGPQKLTAAGMNEAKQAESFVQKQQIPQAIAAYQALETKFPGVPAISFRLAQLHDNSNDFGAALYYYRKHMTLNPQRTLDEATARVTALELMPNVSEGAAAFAQKIGTTTLRAATPTPHSEHQITVAKEDGSLVPIRTEEEWQEFNAKGKTSATPIPRAQTTPFTIEIPRNGPTTATKRMAEKTPKVTPNNGNSPGVYAGATPQPADEDALLIRSLVSPTPAVPKQTVSQHLEQIPTMPELTPSVPEPFVPDFSQITTPPGQKPGTPERPAPPRATPKRRVAYVDPEPATDDVQAKNFFRITPDPSGKTALQISNSVEDSILTIQAYPKDQSEPIQVIMAASEQRNIPLPPGTYQVTISLTTTNYPPQPLFKTTFEYRFDKAQQYGRQFTKENLQAF